MSLRRAHLRLFAIATLVATVALCAMVALPHDRYIRWQAIRTEAFARLGWIYERIHFDRTPIDVAFIGTSHTMNGIDAADLTDRVRQSGITEADSGCFNAVNLSIPAYGRNLHWLITRELLENRQVRTLVIEVFENETRKPHPLFYSVANVRDVLDAPILINIDYALDVLRLPWRQLGLFVKSLWPAAFGLHRDFDPARYDGSNVDNTRVVNVGGVALTPFRDRQIAGSILDSTIKARAQTKNLHYLGKSFERFEYAVPDTYLGKMLALAKSKGVKVVFLYLPGYGLPPKPFDMSRYDGKGPMLFVNDLLARRDFWYDVDHLNVAGAQAVTARVAAELSPLLAADPAFRSGQKTTAGQCRGLPARPISRPFINLHPAAIH